MKKLSVIDLFSGIGGFSLGLESTGHFETVEFWETDPFCQEVLRKHWKDVPIYEDVRYFGLNRQPTQADVVCGGFPCQPFSVAGKRKGADDERYLWEAMFRVVQEAKPSWVVCENVKGLINYGLERMVSDLEREGYSVQTFLIGAEGLGLPHKRERVFVVAYSEDNRRNRRCLSAGDDKKKSCKRKTITSSGFVFREDGAEALSRVCRNYYGIPSKLDKGKRLKALGNAVVPQIIMRIGEAILEAEGIRHIPSPLWAYPQTSVGVLP